MNEIMETTIGKEDICWEYEVREHDRTIATFEYDAALAYFLSEEIILTNTNWQHKKWPDEAKNTIALYVLCNDVFAWACADAEPINYEELDTLWEYHTKDQIFGCSVWCMKQRGILPQKPIYDKIQEQGIWDLDKMKLEANVSWILNHES